MIVAVCADKGSPGVTTLCAALALVWPGERLVLEADPSGADLPLRLESAGGGPLEHTPNVLSLAADARIGLPAGALPRYAQDTALGVPVIPGALSAEAYLPLRALWPGVAGEAARWPGTVIADLGRLQPGHTALPIAQAATAVVLLARPTLDGLFHLRDRVYELAHLLGRPAGPGADGHGPDRFRSPVTVAVLSAPKQERVGMEQVTGMLEAMGAPVRVAGAIADDPRTVQALYAARLDRRAARTPLLSSATALAASLTTTYPELTAALADAGTTGSTAEDAEIAAAGPGAPGRGQSPGAHGADGRWAPERPGGRP